MKFHAETNPHLDIDAFDSSWATIVDADDPTKTYWLRLFDDYLCIDDGEDSTHVHLPLTVMRHSTSFEVEAVKRLLAAFGAF